MYRQDAINALFGLVGWQQHYDTDFKISEALTQSTSGMFYQSEHPLCTLTNLKAVAPDFSKILYPQWGLYTQYRAGAYVKYEDINYIALQNNVGKIPSSSPSFWQVADAFSTWLESKTKASINRAVQSWYNGKLVGKASKSILESRTLFDGSGRLSDLIPSSNSLVGFEIIPLRAKGATLKLEAVGTQFTQTGELTLYVYHSSSAEVVKTISLNLTKAGTAEWHTQPDLYLPYETPFGAGGSWYIMYDQNEVTNRQAVLKVKDWSAKPCGSCSPWEASNWRTTSAFAEFHPVRVAHTDVNTLWDTARNMYDPMVNYGLNFRLSVGCDVTDLIIANKEVFRDVISKQVACDVLRELAYNPNARINRNIEIAPTTSILYELDGDSTSYKKSGLVHSLKRAIDALNVNTEEIDRVCLGCKKDNKIKFRTT